MATAEQEWHAILALAQLGFNGGDVVSLSELKQRYRDLAKQHHPDLGGDAAKMAELNSTYQVALRGYTES